MSTVTSMTNEPADAAARDAQPPAAESSPTAPAASSMSIDELRTEIDRIDGQLLELIQRRSEISHQIGETRASQGGTRMVYSREMKILDRFAPLGPAGTELAMLLLSLGRGRLGRR